MSTRIALSCALLAIFFSGFSNYSLAQNTSTTGILKVPQVGSNCTQNACGACAKCVDLRVSLPQGARVNATRCLTSANYPNDVHSSNPNVVDCTTDNAWSVFDQPVVDSSGSSVVVYTTYHNRSSDRARYVELQVDWERQ